MIDTVIRFCLENKLVIIPPPHALQNGPYRVCHISGPGPAIL
mgnify:CR=1 FL=1